MERPAHVLLLVTEGPMAGARIELTHGGNLTVGRTSKSDVVLSGDTYLSGLHFRISFDGKVCMLRDERSANGTQVNGRPVSETNLQHGDRIEAGHSRFVVHIEAVQDELRNSATINMAAPALNPLQLEVARQLKLANDVCPLFALLDPPELAAISILARAPQFQPLMDATGGHRESYLVQLDGGVDLVDQLIPLVWGRGRGVFLTSGESFAKLRAHLQSFSLTHTGNGQTLRFRFHDPRMLQLFLDSSSTPELLAFFGPVRSFLCEDHAKESQVLEYSVARMGLRRSVLRLGTELVRAAAART